nr:putative ribonuclease H-like domain-containing protein [Tanacetum cinerariifolium]
MFDCDDYLSSESDCESWPPSSLYDRFQPSVGYHAISPPYTGTFMPPKPNLVFNTAPTAVETDHLAFNLVEISIPATTPTPTSSKSASSGKRRNRKSCFVCKSVDHLIKDCDYQAKKMAQPSSRNYAHMGTHKQYASLTHSNPQKHKVPAAVLTQSTPVSITAVRPVVSAVVPKIKVTRPRLTHPIVTKSKSPIRRYITRSQSPKTINSPSIVTAVQALVVSAAQGMQGKWGNLQYALKDKGVIDSRYSWHMTGNMSYLSNFEELNGGYVAFGGNPKGGKISGKGKIKTSKLDFDDVYFVKELKFNLFSVSQMCDKKNSVLFTDTEYLVLSPDFRLADESQVLLRVPRENNMYNVNLKNIATHGLIWTKFKNNDLNQLCGMKGIKREFSVPRTPQQNGIAERKNMILIKNKMLVTKPHNKTPYELLHGRTLSIGFMRLFGCHVTIPNTLDSLGKFKGKNYDGDAAFDGKEHDFDAKKPESEVILSPNSSAQSRKQDDKTNKEAKGKSLVESFTGYRDLSTEFEDCSDNSSNAVNAAGTIVPTIGQNSLNNTNTFSAAGPSNAADFNNLESSITISLIPTIRGHKDHPVSQIIGDLSLTTQTRSMTRVVKDQVDLPHRKRAIGTKWVFKNKKNERGIVVRNKARLVVQGHTQEEVIDYKEVFSPVAKIEAIRLFLAYASFMGFMVYQMDVKSAFLYGTIEEKVYVCQALGFEDPDHPDKVYKVVKALYGLHQAPRACQDKYVAEILRKFRLTKEKSASTPIDSEKPLLKDPDGRDADVHTYRLMIGSLMYLTLSRPYIMFAAADFPMSLLQKALDACAALIRRVEHLEYDKVAQALEITKLKRRVKKLEKGNKGRMIVEMDKDDVVVLIDDKEEDKKVEETKEDETEPAQVQEVVDVVTTAKLITEGVTVASETVTDASIIIPTAEPQVPAATLSAAPARVAAAPSKRRKGVVIKDPEEDSTTSTIIPETKSKDKGKGILVEEPKPLKKKQQIEMDEEYARKLHAELNKDIDWDVAIDHVKLNAKEDPAVQRYQAMKRKPQTEAQAKKNMMMYLKNVAGFKLDYFKGMSYDDIRLIFEAKFNPNVDFLLKTKEQMEEEENRALQMINETPVEKTAKRRKLNKEVEDLKRHLEIVPNEDDDVYTEATSLARKVPVVDYEIIELNNKLYYKIIRADGTHQLYISFLTLLKNFDREDLEALWNLVKERFFTAKPNNFSDDFLLTTLGAMFEKPDAHAQIWKNQITVHGQAKVKSWKLLESCGVHIITFTTTQLILLIEKRILQDSSEPSNDNNNIVNALQEPFVVKQDPSENSSQSPPQINHHCCYGCGDSLEDIFCHQCTCELCGKGANYGYNCPPKVPIIPDLEPFNNQTVDELPQTLPCFDPTCYSEDGNSFTCDSTPNYVDDSPNVFHPPLQPPMYLCEFCGNDARLYHCNHTHLINELDNSLSMRDEHLDTILATESDEFMKSSVENLDFSNSNDDSISIDDDSFSIDNIEYVEASPPNSKLVSLEVMEIVIPEVGGIDDDILLTIKDDILCEKLLNIKLLIANIEALKDNPTLSSDFMTKSSSTSFNSLLEETSTSNNSLPKYETFCFDLEEISSGNTTTRSDISLPYYEAFYNDYVKKTSSSNTTTHFDSSLYDSFIFDLLINPFPPVDISDFYKFTDELAHIISPPEYDCFRFKNEPNSKDFTMDVVEDIFPTRELRVHNVFPTHPTL